MTERQADHGAAFASTHTWCKTAWAEFSHALGSWKLVVEHDPMPDYPFTRSRFGRMDDFRAWAGY